MSIEDKLKELGIELQTPPSPVANYIPVQQTGNLIYLSGQGPRDEEGNFITGKVGADISVEHGIEAAKLCVINIIAAVKTGLDGDWNKLDSFVKLTGFVNCLDNFTEQPTIINGASDLLVDIFGDQGRHARVAVGSNALPLGISVEIDAIVQLK